MEYKSDPIISEYQKRNNYTYISFSPDLKRFKMEILNEDIVSLMSKRVYDIAGNFAGKLKVFLNGKLI